MKNIQAIRTFALTLALSAGAAFAEEDKDENVAFVTLPAAVQNTIQAQADAKGATVGDVEKETEDGNLSYEAEIVQKDGKKFEVEVAEDGTLAKVKADDDEKEDKQGKDEEKDDDDEEEK